MSKAGTRTVTLPINHIFQLLQSNAEVEVWLFEEPRLRIEGRILGFDEYMNLVLGNAVEVRRRGPASGKGTEETIEKREIGRIMLKGENITLVRAI